jgi:hypothetical protein
MAGTVLSGELGGNYAKLLMRLGEKVIKGGLVPHSSTNDELEWGTVRLEAEH